MRISRWQKHIKQLLRITLCLSRKLRQLAHPAALQEDRHQATHHDIDSRLAGKDVCRRHVSRVVVLDYLERLGCRHGVLCCAVSLGGGGGALAGGSRARLMKWGPIVLLRHVIRHSRQAHFHKAQHTRRYIGFYMKSVMNELLCSCSRLSGAADAAAFQ
jgi:hypothetical protein